MATPKKYVLWREEIERYERELALLKERKKQGEELSQREEVRLRSLPWKLLSLKQRHNPNYRNGYQSPIIIIK